VVNHLRSAETPDQRPLAPAAAPSAANLQLGARDSAGVSSAALLAINPVQRAFSAPLDDLTPEA
jgi:hypothetical protein